jgi:outer membrane biosynthesis protein TonB
MREETWFKMILASALLHVLIVSAFSIPFHPVRKTVDLSYYSVNLVGDIGQATDGNGPARSATDREKPSKAPAREIKKKETIQPREKERSIAPQKQKEKPAEPKKKEVVRTTREEVSSLDETIRRMRRKVEYLDVGAKGGTSGQARGLSGSGRGNAPLDPAMAQYYNTVKEKIEEAWNPSSLAYKKNLAAKISIKIRKDGMIVDINVDEGSGNRVYDESILRSLRSIDRLPSIPSSLGLDTIELGFRFVPERPR